MKPMSIPKRLAHFGLLVLVVIPWQIAETLLRATLVLWHGDPGRAYYESQALQSKVFGGGNWF